MELGSYQHIQGYVLKSKQVPKISMESESIITSVSAMVQLEGSCYRAAAELFLQLPFSAADHLWEFISSRDVAIYGGLCALATFNRDELKIKVMENAEFKQYLELEPNIRELLRAFYSSKFSKCFDIIYHFRVIILLIKNEFALDLFLQAHLDSLYYEIKNRAILQYSLPFSSLDMRLMAGVFQVSIAELETQIAHLIGSDQLDARIDSHKKVK